MADERSSWLARALSSDPADEQLRRVAAKATHEIVLRRGDDLGVWVGCGYPKSGTVWLCQLMSAYLDKPYPREYQSPIMMPAVIHAHWPWDQRLPPTVYVIRDGRDVMVSLYFHQVRMFSNRTNPRRTRALRERFRRLYGIGFDPCDIRANLPNFIDFEMSERDTLRGWNWAEHVRNWADRDRVAQVRYEALLADTESELHRAMVQLDAPRQDRQLARLAADRYDFALSSGRTDNAEDRSSFLRKGVAGDWRQHFTKEAAEVFDSHAGDVLEDCGYVSSRDWHESL